MSDHMKLLSTLVSRESVFIDSTRTNLSPETLHLGQTLFWGGETGFLC